MINNTGFINDLQTKLMSSWCQVVSSCRLHVHTEKIIPGKNLSGQVMQYYPHTTKGCIPVGKILLEERNFPSTISDYKQAQVPSKLRQKISTLFSTDRQTKVTNPFYIPFAHYPLSCRDLLD